MVRQHGTAPAITVPHSIRVNITRCGDTHSEIHRVPALQNMSGTRCCPGLQRLCWYTWQRQHVMHVATYSGDDRPIPMGRVVAAHPPTHTHTHSLTHNPRTHAQPRRNALLHTQHGNKCICVCLFGSVRHDVPSRYPPAPHSVQHTQAAFTQPIAPCKRSA